MLSLQGVLKVPVSGVVAARLAAIDSHDYSGVMRHVKKEFAKLGKAVTDEWLEAGVLALKQYYAIAVLDAKNMHAVSAEVDPFWHAHILHTKQYVDFCQEIAGRYLHHNPLDHADKEEVGFVKQLYDFTLQRYDDCFAMFDRRFYPANPNNDDLVCTHGGDDSATALFPAVAEAQPRRNSVLH